MHHSAEIAVVGYGTNDSRYYYSLGSHIVTPHIHFEILVSLIKILRSVGSFKHIILVPVPPVNLTSDHFLNHSANSMIRETNLLRQRIAQSFNTGVSYLNGLVYDNSDLSSDGLHLNEYGITKLADSLHLYFNLAIDSL